MDPLEGEASRDRGESRSGLITKLLGFYTGNNRGTIVHREGNDRLPNPTATFAERNKEFQN